jgi:glycosyltransferase involved in cell wall biosynthesis
VHLDAESEIFGKIDRKFDFIVCREVLEHIENYSALLVQIRKLLKDDGLLILSVPTGFTERLFSLFDPAWAAKSQHVNVFSKKILTQIFDRTRFAITKLERQGFKWALFWLLLSPLRVDHVMGNPKSHRRIVSIALKLVKAVSSLSVLDTLGNYAFPKSYFFYVKKRRPRVLVVYDYPDWILGRWAKQIEIGFCDKLEIMPVSMFECSKDARYTKHLVETADLIHFLLPHCFELFKPLLDNKKVITTINHWMDWSFVSRAAMESDEIMAVSTEWRNKLVAQGVPANRVTVVNCGVEECFFGERAPLLEPSSKTTIGFFGKLDSNEQDRKGTRHFVRLVEHISSSGNSASFRIVIAGQGWRELAGEMRMRGIEVMDFGYVQAEKMPNLYRSVDVYLVLSDVEGGPVTILEAMASNTLVFSTRIGLAADIIQEGETGIIIDAAKPREILSKLMYYRNNPEAAQALRERARRFVRGNMTFAKVLSPLGELYERVLR